MSVRFFARSRPALARLTALLPHLPSSCALCRMPAQELLCSDCHADFLGVATPRCTRCALPLPLPTSGSFLPTRCSQCLRQPPPFDASVAVCDYAAPLDQLVRRLKFGSQLALAPLMGHLLHLATSALDPAERPDLLCPIPLGRQRLQERGFNQALEIARPLAKALQCELAPRLLLRVRDTPAQALLPPEQRHHNIRGAFRVAEATGASLQGRHIGLVDDVMTTGDTLAEAARTLKQQGAARVTCLVFARTPLY